MMTTETNRDMRGRFAKRETIGRMPRTPDGLSDDAWPQLKAGDTIKLLGQTCVIAGVVTSNAASANNSRGMSLAQLEGQKPAVDALERAMIDDDIIMPAPPVQWQTTPDRDWFSWRDWEWRDLWAVAFVGVVLAFAAHVVGWWPA